MTAVRPEGVAAVLALVAEGVDGVAGVKPANGLELPEPAGVVRPEATALFPPPLPLLLTGAGVTPATWNGL
jgi:hypothetical protein